MDPLIIIFGMILCMLYFYKIENFTNQFELKPGVFSSSLKEPDYSFKSYNADVPVQKQEAHTLKGVFKRMVKNPLKDTNGFTQTEGFNTVNYPDHEKKEIMNFVLKKINQSSNQVYKFLDKQFLRKEIKRNIERFKGAVFILEVDSESDYSKNIIFTVDRDPSTKKKEIRNIELLGNNYYQVRDVDSNDPSDTKSFEIHNKYYLTEPFPGSNGDVLLPDSQIDTVVRQRNSLWKEPQSDCFFETPPTVTDLNFENAETCKAANGIYDSPATSNEQCPFFKKNQNYPNMRGGVKGSGYCELPLNMKRIGYKHYSKSPSYKPWCYNCKKGIDDMPNSIGQCCDEQVEPDYAFPGDTLERGYAKNVLKKKGLHWSRHPSKMSERDQFKPNTSIQQKQPVFNKFVSTSY